MLHMEKTNVEHIQETFPSFIKAFVLTQRLAMKSRILHSSVSSELYPTDKPTNQATAQAEGKKWLLQAQQAEGSTEMWDPARTIKILHVLGSGLRSGHTEERRFNLERYKPIHPQVEKNPEVT